MPVPTRAPTAVRLTPSLTSSVTPPASSNLLVTAHPVPTALFDQTTISEPFTLSVPPTAASFPEPPSTAEPTLLPLTPPSSAPIPPTVEAGTVARSSEDRVRGGTVYSRSTV